MTNQAMLYVPLPARGTITVGGQDRVAFLQGLVSNDVRRVAPDRAVWAAFLTPQGKYLHDFFIVERDGIMHLDCEKERLMELGKSLSRYKLRSVIDLGVAEDLAAYAVIGAGALAALDLPEEPGAARALDSGTVYVDPRHTGLGARALMPASGASALEALGFRKGTLEDYDRVRLPLGVPDGSRDLVVEKSILLESNFDELNGVDWKKGCYMGQELTARTKYRGLIKKRLVPVSIDGPPPEPGAAVRFEDREAGEMRSVSGGYGLALLRLDALAKSREAGEALAAGEARLTPQLPAWADFG